MEIRFITIDDEPLGVALVSRLAEGYPELKKVQGFTDAVAGLEYMRKEPADLLFIDIRMPDLTGIELVRKLDPKPMVIFTTAYRDFAVESYELEAIDYLVKPIDPKRFAQAVKKAIDFFTFKNPELTDGWVKEIFVRSEYQLVRINLADVLYIESLEDYLRIHLVSQKPVMTLMTMKGILEKLPGQKFKRIHRSYIVALDQVGIAQHKKLVVGGVELPVGESYLAGLQDWLRGRL